MLKELIGKLIFPEVTVMAVRDIGPRFRVIQLGGESMKRASYKAGDKVQLNVPGGTRTYTPFAFDKNEGTFEILAYVHGDTPGSTWARNVAVGATCNVFGPRGSLPLTDLLGPLVIFGDETSFGVVASITRHRSGAPDVHGVFEVASFAEAEGALAALDLTSYTLVERTGSAHHLREIDGVLREKLTSNTQLVLTGKAQSIQSIRAALKERPASFAGSKVKAYWSVGKRGLD